MMISSINKLNILIIQAEKTRLNTLIFNVFSYIYRD